MTSKQIEEQIAAIRTVTAEVLKSKESAIQFLTEAGIIKTPQNKTGSKKTARTTKQ
jgi:hypothetical protein